MQLASGSVRRASRRSRHPLPFNSCGVGVHSWGTVVTVQWAPAGVPMAARRLELHVLVCALRGVRPHAIHAARPRRALRSMLGRGLNRSRGVGRCATSSVARGVVAGVSHDARCVSHAAARASGEPREPNGMVHIICHEACCTVYTTMPVARYLQHEHAENRVNHTRPTDVHTDARFESELQQEIAELRTDLKAIACAAGLLRPIPSARHGRHLGAFPLRRIPTSAYSRLGPSPLRRVPT